MSKFKIVLISIFTIALIILTSAVVYQNIKYDKLAKEEEKVTDECIYENNEIENDIDEIKVNGLLSDCMVLSKGISKLITYLDSTTSNL